MFLLSLYPAQKEHAVFGPCRDHVGRIWRLCCAYVLEAMLGPNSSQVELMSSQERRVPLKPLPGPKGTRRLDHVGTMLGVYGAYVGPMLAHVRLLAVCWGCIRAMLSLC